MDKIKLKNIQLVRTLRETNFYKAYEKLIKKDTIISEAEKFLLLKTAIVFFNYGETELEKFGYRIILMYSNLFSDYKPLYDISLNKDYIPVSKFIENKYLNSEIFNETFHGLLMSSYKEDFKHPDDNKKIYFSSGQKRLFEFSKNENDFIIVAPTSYGKSELIVQKVENNLDKNICIIVPTKSLLSQTRKRIIQNSIIRESRNRIITHPDMLSSTENNFIAVLTQERLLRLLQKHPSLKFDMVLIDEAHNLVENDNREILTIQNLKILKKRNSEIKYYYFTPFFIEPEKLKIFKNYELLTDKIYEFIKVEKYFVCDLISDEKIFKVYDQFLNEFFDIEYLQTIQNSFQFINRFAANKNIIYINRPKYIEKFSKSINNPIEITESIRKVQKALKEFLHGDYNLIKTLNNGIVYHHGGMPENVRLYVENAFSKIKEIKYVVTTSTLLQGVNIPAEKIFLLDTKKGTGNLNSAQFKNLVGRICRFSEVFDNEKGSLRLLEPEVYIIKSDFSDSRANIENFLKERVKDNKIITDEIDNPLIKNNLANELTIEEENQIREAEEFQENIEEGTSELDNLRIVTSHVAKACFKNNIHDFDIFENEIQLEENYNNSRNINLITTPDRLIFLIAQIFLFRIKLKDDCTENFKRLENDKAKSFYSMFLEWRTSGTSYNEMINKFIWYWDNVKEDPYIYVGSRWGEIISPYKGGFRELYIDLSKKTPSDKINIAILRIKEEQDFIDFNLMPYVEILNDLNLIESSFYDKIKYGTSDTKMIKLLKEGFSIELAKVIKTGLYDHYVNFENDLIVNSNIIQAMEENDENEILKFEIQYYINN
ncbi:DEAD/DEAH box helicase family protein [Aliarcobacter butzleri]|uniref:DEAD/DEAH box helicase family protein n=1 Tax=Aliarcobacter butzleri TaxID=28197 RepID=UPI002B24257F|nr:DEAD/DEAH box helicase family protein [Aliarcobacter butzleri]